MGVKQIHDLENLWADSSVVAVAVCTENSAHVELGKPSLFLILLVTSANGLLVREALRHNKHVLVEYPLCFTHVEAKELFELARERGLVLSVELIGLLSRPHLRLKECIQKRLNEWGTMHKDEKKAKVQAVIKFVGGISKDIPFDGTTGLLNFR